MSASGTGHRNGRGAATGWRELLLGLARMSRPDQLLLVAVVYALGTAIALAQGVTPDTSVFLGGLGGVLFVAASIHYANEYADYETDRLTERTPFSGGSGALVEYDLPRRLPLVAAVVTFVIGLAIAVACTVHGQPVVGVGVLLFGAVFGWMYSLPPLALAWNGLGELGNAMLGGLALPAYGYATQTGRVDATIVLACLPFALLTFANLLDTTWPDREADAAVGKETLATRWSPRRLHALYILAVASAFALLVALAGGVLPTVVAYGSFLALPFAVWGTVTYTRKRSPFPTVAAMVVLVVVQLVGWAVVAGYVPPDALSPPASVVSLCPPFA